MGSERTVECPKCERNGEESRVFEHTAIGLAPIRTFRDDDGRVHVHEPVPVRTNYECSQGHHFELEELVSCPTCGWKATI